MRSFARRRLPAAGRRREGLTAAIDAMVPENFAVRTLSFDSAAASRLWQPIAEADCQIAAIALAYGAAVARNIADPSDAGSRSSIAGKVDSCQLSRRPAWVARGSDHEHLAQLDDAVGRKPVEARGVTPGLAQGDEEVILPQRHAGLG
jgi:hypothetical protein